MSTSFNNLYGRLVQFTRRLEVTRRKSQPRWTMVEDLEQRALLSAANTLVVEPEVQVLNLVHQGNPSAMQQQTDALADLSQGDIDPPALKFGSLKQHHNAKQASAKSFFNRNDFSGDWNLGTGGQPPSNSIVLHVQQFGRKVTATLEAAGSTIAVMSGKIKQGQFVADLNATQGITTGKLTLQKTSNTTFIGVLSITAPGQPTQSTGLTGAK